MRTGREQLGLYLVLLLAVAVSAYILGCEIITAWHWAANQLEEAIR